MNKLPSIVSYLALLLGIIICSRAVAVIAPPSLISPMDGADGVTMPVACTWGAVNSATTYVLQLATDVAFTKNLVTRANLATPNSNETLTPTPIWHVKTVTGTQSSAWSSTQWFTTAFDYQPDVQVKAPADAAFLGVNVMDPTGASETKALTVPRGSPATYLVQLVNHGVNPDAFTSHRNRQSRSVGPAGSF